MKYSHYKNFILFGLAIFLLSSCSKTKNDPDKGEESEEKYSTTINGVEYNLETKNISTTYYSTEGDEIKALFTSAALNTQGDNLTFFIGDFKDGSVDITRKEGTIFKIATTSQAPNSVQSYIRFSAASVDHYATSGLIQTKTLNNVTTISWDATFKDEKGKEFSSKGVFVSKNISANSQPKSQIVDPTASSSNPVIESIIPSTASSRDTITFNGANFSTDIANISVMFTNRTSVGIVINATITRIQVIVPDHGYSGPVILEITNKESLTGPRFTFKNKAEAYAINPYNARPGDTIAILGTSFNTVLTDNKVTLVGGTNAEVISSNNGRLRIIVPPGAQSGMMVVKGNGYIGVTQSINIYSPVAPIP